MGTRAFIPFGEFLPDRKLFSNEGLLRAFGMTPMAGTYVRSPGIFLPGNATQAPPATALTLADAGDTPYGFGLHSAVASGVRKLYGYYGTNAKLIELDITAAPALAETDRSRLAGGAYAFAGTPLPLDSEMWWFTSYGENVIATNFEDEVQFLATPGSGNFANMITSTFKPQFRFVVPIRQNLFGFYAFLPAIFDGIPAGTHPQLGAWSMNDNIRVFGSENVDPAHIGAGYQQYIGGDLGPITVAIGGDFGLVFQAHGITRIDGPPYEFRTIVIGDSTLYPYSVFRLGDDIYFWGSGGPSVLFGGEPPVVRLGVGKLQRSLLDNATGFGVDFARAVDLKTRECSGAQDPVNEIMRWSYRPIVGATINDDVELAVGPPMLLLDYNASEKRFGVSRSVDVEEGEPAGDLEFSGIDLYLRSAPPGQVSPWGPFGSVYGIKVTQTAPGLYGNSYLFRYELNSFTYGRYGDLRIKTGFGRFNDRTATRIVAVRPIWTSSTMKGATIASGIVVRVHTMNKPYEDETTTGPFTMINDDGWVGTDDSVVGSYHAVTLEFDGAKAFEAHEIHEIEGLEIEFVEEGSYGA